MKQPSQIMVSGEYYEYELEVDGFKNTLSCEGGWWILGEVRGEKTAPAERYRATTKIGAIARALGFMATESAKSDA